MSKPDWKEAPEWVLWMAQDGDGTWFGYDQKPDLLEKEWGREGARFFDRGGRCILLEHGCVSGKWKESLEARP